MSQATFISVSILGHVMVSSLVEGDTGFKSWSRQKNPLLGHPKNSGRVPACGTYGWFGPSYQGLVALVANPVGCGWPRLRCGWQTYRVKPEFRGFLGRSGWGFFSVIMPQGRSVELFYYYYYYSVTTLGVYSRGGKVTFTACCRYIWVYQMLISSSISCFLSLPRGMTIHLLILCQYGHNYKASVHMAVSYTEYWI